MALPWLLAYSREVRSVYTTLKRAAREGIGADRVYQFLVDSGHDLIRSEVREIVGILKADLAWEKYIASVPDTETIIKRFLPISPTRMVKNFRYTMKVAAENIKTGVRSIRTLSLTSNDLLTKQDAIGIMTDNLSERNGEPYLSVESVDVAWIERRA